MKQMKKSTRNLAFSALCLALCLVLPLLTGQIPQIGNMLCPMHLPVLLCGFLCGPLWGLAVGFIAPLLRGVIFGMPPFFPTGIAMAFELATYGFVSGALYKALRKNTVNLFISLIVAMIAGRIVWGCVRAILSGASGAAFTWDMFIAGAFTTAIPGIILQLIFIPLLVTALKKSRLMQD